MDDVGEFQNRVLHGYARAASDLITPYDTIDCEHLFTPVRHMFPTDPARVADLGAGTGRDARWLAAQGHRVTAIEPVDAFRAAGQSHACDGIEWINDRLPDLLRVQTGVFDLCLINGVWQHLTDVERRIALPRIAGLLRPGGHAILSLRLGPGPKDRPVIPIDVKDTLAMATDCGLTLRDRVDTNSIQPGNQRAGVTWSWLWLRAAPICDR